MKLVVVGDAAVGKSSLLLRTVKTACDPTIFDKFSSSVMVNGLCYNLDVWDTSGSEDYDRLRPLSYPETDVLLICYSMNNRWSFENIKAKWYPHVTSYCPNTPILIVATKIDLCGPTNTDERGQQCVSYEEGVKLAWELHCGFVETSVVTHIGVEECFAEAVSLHLTYSRGKIPRVIRPVPPSTHARPAMPPVGPAPRIEIKTSSFGTDMASILDDPSGTDVVFHFDDGKSQAAHRLVLCSASDFFCRVFEQTLPKDQQEDRPVRVPAFTWNEINSGGIAGLSSIKQAEEGVGHQVDVCLSADMSSQTFTHVLRFLYAGMPNVDKDTPDSDLGALLKASDIFYLPKLREIITNIQNKEEESLNLQTGKYLNDLTGQRLKEMFFNKPVFSDDLTGQRLKEMFFNKPVFSDVQFEVEGQILYAHKAILKARCPVMAGMFSGVFAESPTRSKLETSMECFMAILEYVYTDNAPIEKVDAFDILVAADKFALERLKNLCEQYITKKIDDSVSEQIKKADKDPDIDVIDLLKRAQFHNIDQLSAWCLHFISFYYLAFEKRPEFSQLEGDNLAHVMEKRWPPVSYLEELETWETEYGDHDSQKKSKKCSVM